jgi:cytochrome c553
VDVMRDDVMHLVSTGWRSLVFGLAAAVLCAASAFGQSTPLAERIQLCSACHGEDGNSRMENIPSLAGQPEFFILNQLFLMREGVRRIEVMMPMVKDLKDDEMEALAKHFARLTPKVSDEPVDPALVTRGSELAAGLRCGSCHLPTLAGQEQMPRLAKQRIDYMIHAMKEFRDDKRSGADTLMTSVVLGRSDADLTALAHYAASR